MARRAGKAASRKARQRRSQRPSPPRAPASVAPPIDAAPDEPRAPDPPRRVSRAPVTASVGSTLTDRERAEYHYVERDLRNIGILTVVMIGLLILAYFVFSAAGLTG